LVIISGLCVVIAVCRNCSHLTTENIWEILTNLESCIEDCVCD